MDDPHSFSIRSFSSDPFTLCSFFFIETTYQPRHPSALTLTMGKSDEKQTKNRPHKANDGENKHKKQPSLEALRSNPLETPLYNYGEYRHSKWCESSQQLCEFKVQFGHCRVPNRYSIHPKLGWWVSSQRTRYMKNTEEKSMSAEHIRALDGIGFDWGTSKTDVASIWSVRFQQLCEFKEKVGHCIVPQKYSANPKLGRWVSTQRHNCKLYQEGRPNALTAERIRALDDIGFGCSRARDY